ncbi:hypothetical protein MW887_005749 [Aspergillus wentii]|nr:hypothetical protein MW887_005749 [Aspergillus wentii]
MANQFLPRGRLRWTHGRPKKPIWPREPSLDSIRSLAFSVLHKHFPNDYDEERLLDVTFHAEKLTKRIFIISHPKLAKKFIFQVQLPVDPFFLTENEIATISFLRHNTDIPVPPILAWNSSSDNVLGYEWSMVEMLDGVPVREIWAEMSLDAKLRLAEDLAHIFAQLWNQKFDRIGSLFISQRLLDSTEQFEVYFEDPPSPSFKVGQMVSMPFFIGRRCFLPSDRGPFKSSRSWIKAQIDLELEYVITGQEILQLSPELGPEDINLQPEFLETLDDFQDVCQDYFRALPSVFPSPDEESLFHLCHHGLNEENILLDPTSYEILGILDWDMTSVLPVWLVQEHSRLFRDISFKLEKANIALDSSEPSDTEFRGWNVFPKRLLDPDPEHAEQLQHKFDEILRNDGVKVPLDKPQNEQKDFYTGVLYLGSNWEIARQYLSKIPHFKAEWQQLGWSDGLDESSSSDFE